MKRIILAIILCLSLSAYSYAEVTRQGNNYSVVKSNSKSEAKQTNFTYTLTNGETLPIFISKNGRAYVVRKSAKTGKEYKQYLGENISREICKELGVTYVEKQK